MKQRRWNAPLEVDARLRSHDVTMAVLRAAIPSHLLEPVPHRAWLAIARALATIAIGEALLGVVALKPWALPAVVLAWLVVAAGMVGLFIIGHDCGHFAFSRTRWVNVVVGHFCMSPILTGFRAWQLSHAHHHARTGLRGDDTDWPEQMLTRAELETATWRERIRATAAYASPIGLLLGFTTGMIRRTFMSTLYPQVKTNRRTRLELLLSNALMVVTSGGIAVWLVRTRGWSTMLVHYAVPLYFGMVLGALFTYLHHSGEGSVVFDRPSWTFVRGQLTSTFDVRFPRWFERLFFHINRHPAHHVSTRVPWYGLPRANDALRSAFPDLAIERRFAFSYLLRAWRTSRLEPEAGVLIAARPIAREVREVHVTEDAGRRTE